MQKTIEQMTKQEVDAEFVRIIKALNAEQCRKLIDFIKILEGQEKDGAA